MDCYMAQVGDIVRVDWGNNSQGGRGRLNGVVISAHAVGVTVTCAFTLYGHKMTPNRLGTDTDVWQPGECKPVKAPTRIRDQMAREYLLQRQAELRRTPSMGIWWCEHCACVVPPKEVTFAETHDPLAGGCGEPVKWQEPDHDQDDKLPFEE